MIRVQCPACGRGFDFADYLAALTAVCKHCGHGIDVPRTPSVTGSAAASVPPAALTVSVSEAVPPAPAQAALMQHVPAQPPPSPADVMERVRAMLATGAGAPQVEQWLKGQGFAAEVAAAIVDSVLEDRVRDQAAALARRERRARVHRVMGALVGCSYIGLTYYFFGQLPAALAARNALLPLACICFADILRAYPGPSLSPTASAAWFVRWGGWVVLLLLIARACWLGLAFP
jgi:hypothetical protein